MTTVAVSPHLDDAVLSVGQVLLTQPRPIVLTVFAGVPSDETLTPYDLKCGLGQQQNPVITRRREDIFACGRVGARPSWLDLLDSQYIKTKTDRVRTIRFHVEHRLDQLEANTVLIPLGLLHPDHEDVAAACLSIAERRDTLRWHVYEELPYRVQHPDVAVATLDALRERFKIERSDLMSEWRLPIKEQAVRCYESQLWMIDVHSVLVPERVWALNP